MCTGRTLVLGVLKPRLVFEQRANTMIDKKVVEKSSEGVIKKHLTPIRNRTLTDIFLHLPWQS